MLLSPLLKGWDVPTLIGLLLVHRSNFGQMPFQLPPITQRRYQQELNPFLLGAGCCLNH